MCFSISTIRTPAIPSIPMFPLSSPSPFKNNYSDRHEYAIRTIISVAPTQLNTYLSPPLVLHDSRAHITYSEVFRDLSPLALLVTIIGIAIFMINMFYTKNANREREALARLCDEKIMFDTVEPTMYEPEMFPGLIYRMTTPKAVLLLFSSGRVVCVGCKSRAIVDEAVEKMYELLSEYGLLYP